MVLATGIIKAIAAARSTITVDVLASRVNAAVLGGNPHVRRVITIDKRRPWTYLSAVWRIRREGYDAVVDPMILSASLTVTLLACVSGARHRIGVAGRGNDCALTVLVPPIEAAVHYVDRSAALLAAFGVQPCVHASQPSNSNGWGVWRPELFLTPAELWEAEALWRSAEALVADKGVGGWRLVVNVSASKPEKYWPARFFVATLNSLRESLPGMPILVIGLPDDLARMRQVARETNARIAYTPDYRHMMAVVATGDGVFTADTSVTHVASAFAKPSVVMFVGGGGAYFGPYGTAGCALSTEGPLLESLPAAPVIRALEEMIFAGQGRKTTGAVAEAGLTAL
jgi:ADP-heptose:LPS heptosyltransferase